MPRCGLCMRTNLDCDISSNPALDHPPVETLHLKTHSGRPPASIDQPNRLDDSIYDDQSYLLMASKETTDIIFLYLRLVGNETNKAVAGWVKKIFVEGSRYKRIKTGALSDQIHMIERQWNIPHHEPKAFRNLILDNPDRRQTWLERVQHFVSELNIKNQEPTLHKVKDVLREWNYQLSPVVQQRTKILPNETRDLIFIEERSKLHSKRMTYFIDWEAIQTLAILVWYGLWRLPANEVAVWVNSTFSPWKLRSLKRIDKLGLDIIRHWSTDALRLAPLGSEKHRESIHTLYTNLQRASGDHGTGLVEKLECIKSASEDKGMQCPGWDECTVARPSINAQAAPPSLTLHRHVRSTLDSRQATAICAEPESVGITPRGKEGAFYEPHELEQEGVVRTEQGFSGYGTVRDREGSSTSFGRKRKHLLGGGESSEDEHCFGRSEERPDNKTVTITSTPDLMKASVSYITH
ncbi:hypothetical protein BDV96DRAFT_651583 [Lophiotrema nucula]|uniref:Uncharacterized protein n=1 Tax=Lophiotrema nucula TaxID=690887 RepID=A0A6A5YU32_9PLEO|nr:hypothetical protein BDV96DRAFT_651583 [Lophiotrema nucula]